MHPCLETDVALCRWRCVKSAASIGCIEENHDRCTALDLLGLVAGAHRSLIKGMQSGYACLGDSERANEVNFHDSSELLNRLVHQHCMIGDARIVDQAS